MPRTFDLWSRIEVMAHCNYSRSGSLWSLSGTYLLYWNLLSWEWISWGGIWWRHKHVWHRYRSSFLDSWCLDSLFVHPILCSNSGSSHPIEVCTLYTLIRNWTDHVWYSIYVMVVQHQLEFALAGYLHDLGIRRICVRTNTTVACRKQIIQAK